MKATEMEDAIRQILKYIGEDPRREGLLRTPERVRRSFEYLMRGYSMNLEEILNGALFTEKYDEMVIVRNIDFFSMCEHHLLPFFGKAQVAYIPNGKIVGISKIPRIVEMFSRRLQVQERLTNQIADTLEGVLRPQGVAVVMEAQHLCMVMRGVEKQNAVITTSAMRGVFKTNRATRDEFVELIQQI